MSSSLAGRRVFVAGHRGLLGSAPARRLAREDCALLTAGREELDLTDPPAVRAWIARERPDVVLIAAARVGGVLANRDHPADFLRDNLAIALNLIPMPGSWPTPPRRADRGREARRRIAITGASAGAGVGAPQPELTQSTVRRISGQGVGQRRSREEGRTPMRRMNWMLPLAALLAAAPAFAQAPPPAGGFVVRPATAADYGALARLPDWSGVWQPDWAALFSGRGGRKPVDPDYAPATRQRVDAYVARQKLGENLQTDMANCVPAGMPQIMRMPYPIEFLFNPGRVTVLIETESQVRRIYTDGRPLPDDPDPAFNGSSVGHWEGDTLVVDTIGLNPRTSVMAAVHPTENTKIRETIRLAQPDQLVVTTTITDPALFATPFVQVTPYVRKRDWQIREYVCQENNRDAADANGRPSLNIEEDPFGPAPAKH